MFSPIKDARARKWLIAILSTISCLMRHAFNDKIVFTYLNIKREENQFSHNRTLVDHLKKIIYNATIFMNITSYMLLSFQADGRSGIRASILPLASTN